MDFKLEKGALTDGLLPYLERERERRQRFSMIVLIPRSTRVTKQDRIRGLQPLFQRKDIRFADDLPCKVELIQEIMRFPSQSAGVHDDCLNTLADALLDAEGGTTVDVLPSPQLDPSAQFGMERARDRFIGFREDGSEEWLYGDQPRSDERFPMGIL